MNITGSHLKRYKQIAQLFWKYGRGDLVKQMGAEEHLDDAQKNAPSSTNAEPIQLADDLEAMGPTYVKLGQVLSSRPDMLPDVYVKALTRLQDKVKPFPYADVERIVMEELGVRISKAFSSFDPEPLAAASLGQVHSATLRDGREVVVKVQRPDVRKQIAEDFEVLTQIATFFDAHTDVGRRYRFTAIMSEFQVSIQHELDYLREAQNLKTLGENLKEFERIQVPQPIANFCTRSVLTMERVEGHKLTTLSPVAMLEVDGLALAEEVFRAYLKQVIVDGFFHADPHPGNVFLTSEGRVALLDLGMVGNTSPSMRESLLKILLALSDGKSGLAADTVIAISEKSEAFDAVEFRRRIAHLLAARQGQPLEDLKVGRALLELSGSAAESGLFVPSELTLLGKTLMQLDEIGRVLAPTFNPNDSVRRHVGELASRRMMHSASQGSMFASLLETKAFVMELPARLNRIMDAVTNKEIEVRVKSLDAQMVVEGIQKIANRITMGLILASLIVGAALLMRVETEFRLWGYPGFAMLCFLIAGAGGFWLVATTFIQDHRSRNKPKR